MKEEISAFSGALSIDEMKHFIGGNVPPAGQPDATCTGWTGPDSSGKTTYDAVDSDGNHTCGLMDQGDHPGIGDLVVT